MECVAVVSDRHSGTGLALRGLAELFVFWIATLRD